QLPRKEQLHETDSTAPDRNRSRSTEPGDCHGAFVRAEPGLSANAQGRSGGRLPRREGGRPVSLAGGRQFSGNGEVGGGGEQSHVRLPGKDSLPRAGEGTAGAALQLSEIHGAVPQGRSAFLHEERRLAEPERGV